jgi:hypothetical protein
MLSPSRDWSIMSERRCPLAVTCPYCGHRMRVKGSHAGRFLPACDRCGDTFMLIIPADPDAPMLVNPLDEVRRKMRARKKHGTG